MPAKDIFHNTVKNALQKDGWTIAFLETSVGNKGYKISHTQVAQLLSDLDYS